MPEQHRGGEGRQRRLTSLLCTALATTLLLSVVPAADAAGSGCAGKPGGKNKGAAFQYCPKETARTGESESAPTSGSGVGTQGASTSEKNRGDGTKISVGPEVPLLGYPSTSGLNALLVALLIGAGAMGAYLGFRRLRHSDGEHDVS